MKKRISKDDLKAAITLGYAGLGAALTAWLMRQEEDPNGVLIDTEVVARDLWKLIDDHAIPYINEYVKGIFTLVLGRFLGYLDNIYSFEFGTTRGSKEKDETIKQLTGGGK